jgi:Mrp family chromosome partitioning ATPase
MLASARPGGALRLAVGMLRSMRQHQPVLWCRRLASAPAAAPPRVRCTSTTSGAGGGKTLLSAKERLQLECDAAAAAGRELDPLFQTHCKATLRPGGQLDVHVFLTTGAAPGLQDLRERVARRLQSTLHPPPAAVSVDFLRQPGTRDAAASDGAPESVRHVRHIVSVGSCKGGVGKSTVTVNLAFALAELGARVGILDADVYGSSLGHLLANQLPGRDPHTGALPLLTKNPENNRLRPRSLGKVAALMSYGFVAPGVATGDDSRAVSVRGPVASQIINQIVCGTDWGDLDYLLVDIPPGTGDIHLTMYQQMPVDGHVLVTTPHAASLADVRCCRLRWCGRGG